MDYIEIIDDIFRQFKGAGFSIKFWDGKTRHYGTDNKDSFILHINSAKIVKRLLAEGALGFGESYMSGGLKIEGDIEAYLKLRHQFKHIKPSPRLVLAKFMANLSVPKNKKEQIAYHYDLGNDFFGLFLDDKTMSYSSAHYKSKHDDLGQAQLNKLKLACDWLNLPSQSSILDLGSGWGSFAKYASANYAWHIQGYTLSEKQISYARGQINSLSPDTKVSFEYKNFCRELPETQFDGVVMIEAIEHVGKENLNNFIKHVTRKMKQGAPFYVQFTGRYQPKLVDPWTLKYVFPGGHLPAVSEFLDAVNNSGLLVEKFEDHTEDYKKTMLTWVQSLENHQLEIEKMFDSSFFRLWKLWMRGAHVNFDIGAMNLFRVLLRKK